MTAPALPNLISVREFAERLSISSKTVRRLIDSGQLPIHRIGGQIRIAETDAARFVARRRQVGGHR